VTLVEIKYVSIEGEGGEGGVETRDPELKGVKPASTCKVQQLNFKLHLYYTLSKPLPHTVQSSQEGTSPWGGGGGRAQPCRFSSLGGGGGGDETKNILGSV
jgi:hypothetical protein